MIERRPGVCLLCLPSLAVGVLLSSPLCAQMKGGLSALPGGSMTRVAPVARPANPGASVIGDGMGGFTVYGSSGSSRHVRGAGAPGAVYDAYGRRYQVIEDGRGNLDVHGPSGSSKVFRVRPPGAADPGAAE